MKKINIKNIPEYLKSKNQWMLWKREGRGEKPTKVPYQPNGKRARSNDSTSWSNISSCEKALKSGEFSGLGFAFKEGDGLTGIDLDHCYDNGVLEPWAQDIVEQFKGAYIEKSPSGDGLHIWCLGTPVKTGSVKWSKNNDAQNKQGIEVYDYTSPRYLTVTGKALAGSDISKTQSGLEWLYQEYFADSDFQPIPAAGKTHDIDLIKKALECISSDEYDIWIRIGMALKTGGYEVSVWDEWSQKSDNYEPGVCEEKWDTFNGDKTGIGTLFYLAKKNGFVFPKQEFRQDDIGNSERFIAQYGTEFLWLSSSRSWLQWDGKRWKSASQESAIKNAKQVARSIYKEASESKDADTAKSLAKWAHSSASNQKLEAMIKLARPGLEISGDQLDADIYKINCLNGTLDLKTGKLMPHERLDRITKVIPVEYHLNAKAPLFEKFLAEIFEQKPGLIAYMQAVLGYCLTGSVEEQKLFICYGTGQNGKSTLFNIVREIFGEYAQETDPSLLINKTVGNGASEDVARLRGIRFATTIETNEGVKLNEARVKQLTGGDTLAARPLYGHFMEFQPNHKIFVITNHKPDIRSQGHAMWRRIVMIPFTHQISECKKDKKLAEKLRAEKEGILAWLVQGCLNWLQNGLPVQPEIQGATAEYKSEMDSLDGFLRACCTEEKSGCVQSSTLYKHYLIWCKSTGEEPLNNRSFTNRLREKGFAEKKTNKYNQWLGLSLVPEANQTLDFDLISKN